MEKLYSKEGIEIGKFDPDNLTLIWNKSIMKPTYLSTSIYQTKKGTLLKAIKESYRKPIYTCINEQEAGEILEEFGYKTIKIKHHFPKYEPMETI